MVSLIQNLMADGRLEKPTWSEWRLWLTDIWEGSNVYFEDYTPAKTDLDPRPRLEWDREEWVRMKGKSVWSWYFYPGNDSRESRIPRSPIIMKIRTLLRHILPDRPYEISVIFNEIKIIIPTLSFMYTQ